MSARRYPMRRTAALLAGALALGAAQPAYAALDSTRLHAAAASASVHGPLTRMQATAKARATGTPVQVDAATTEDSTLTANPDGSYTLAENAAPVRKRINGSWRTLDATLVKNPDGSIAPKVSTGVLTLSAGGTGPLATMKQGTDTLSLTLPGTLPAPTLSGTSATYPNVLPDVDLVVTATAQGGFCDVLVVKNAAAARNPALTTLLTASVASRGVTVRADRQGNLTAADARGRAVFTAPAPTLWDSASTAAQPTVTAAGTLPATSSAHSPGRAAHTGKIKPTIAGHSLTLSPDSSVLTGAGVTYPVYFDPAWTPGKSGWATVTANYPTQTYWNSTPDPGGLMQVGNSGSILSHTLINFPLDDADMSGAQITGATLYLTEENSFSCTASTMNVYAPSTVLTAGNAYWNYWTSNLGSTVGSKSFAYGHSATSCPAQSVGIPISTSTIAADVSAAKATQTLALTGVNESSDTNSWKEFLVNSTTSPQLAITYNHPPNTPTTLTMSPNGSCTGTTAGNGDVILYAAVSDRDGGALGVAFTAYKTNSPTTIIKSTSSTSGASNYLAAASGTTAALRIPQATLIAAAGTTPLPISWNVSVSDGSLASGTSKTCSFTFDPTIPGPPTLTDTGQSGCGALTYTVGTGYSFTATNSGTGTISSYLFQLGSSTPISAPATNGTATANITPTRHTNILSVSAVSTGGNIGDSAVCVVNAAVPAFDATTATTASNTATDASAPGDLTGDAVPDLLAVGGQNNLPPGLWLATGQSTGTVLTGAANIGINGDGLNANGTAADWTGTDVLTGQFTGTGFQDVLALYTSGTAGSGNVNGYVLASNGNDGSPLAYLGDQSTTFAVTSDTSCTTGGHCTGLADTNGALPTGHGQVANAGNLSGNGNTPDLLTLSSGTLWLDPAKSDPPGAWAGAGTGFGIYNETALATANPYCSITAGNCTTGWGTWSITTALVGTGSNALPALFARDNSTTSPSAGQLWYYSPAVLQAIATAAMGGNTGTSTPTMIAAGWGNTDVPLIQAANLGGTIALRALGGTPGTAATASGTVATYLLSTTAAGSLTNTTNPAFTSNTTIQTLSTTSHSWALNDNTTTTVNSVTYPTAADTSGSLTATATGSQSSGGASTDATWHTGDLYDPDLQLNTAATGARMTAGTGSLATTARAIDTNATFSASVWVKPADQGATETVLSQDGANGSGFDLYADTAGTWDFALKTSDTAGGAFTTLTGGTVQPGQWTQLTATYDAPAAVMTLYQNGIEVATTTHTKTATGTTASPLRIGADRTNTSSPTTAHYFAGQIADIQTWAAVQPPAQTATPGSYAVPVNPARILDTRNAVGVTTTTPVAAGTSIALQITGRTVTNPATGTTSTIPATGVTAVGLTIQVTAGTANGVIIAYPGLTPRPFTSNLNYAAGQTTSAYDIVPVGTDGKIDLYNNSAGTVHLIADITGYYTTDPTLALASTYNPIHPARILDTRSGIHLGGTTLAAGGTLTFTVAGADTKVLPTSGITALAMNFTVTGATSNGVITAYPGNATTAPAATSLIYAPGTTFATTDILPVGTAGTVKIYNNSTGTTDLVGDVTGYYTASSAGQKYHPLNSTRILDTRQTSPVAAAATQTVTAPATIPDPGATLVLNTTVTDATAAGVLTVYPYATTRPGTSSLNWATGQIVANVTLAQTGTGKIQLYNNSAGSADFIADTNGYFSYPGTPATTSYTPTQTWTTGQSWTAGTNTVTFQTSDGNLTIKNAAGTLLWTTTATTNASTNTLHLTSTGNLEIDNAAGTAVWSAAVTGATTLALQPDGNLALYNTTGNPLWAAGTTN